MGNTATKDTEESTFEVDRIYWDGDGNLRHGNSTRNRDEELIKMLQSDSNDEKDFTKLWMIVPSRWIRQWLIFTHYKMGEEPGRISMLTLLKQDKNTPGGWRPKKNLQSPCNKLGEERSGHYRRISLEAWINLVELYGVDGYALAVRGFPYDDVSRWRVFKDPKVIDINLLPEPVLPQPEEGKVEGKSALKDVAKSITGGFSNLLGGAGVSDKTNDKK